MKPDLSEPISKRIFESTDVDGKIEPIHLILGKPYEIPESGKVLKWRCLFQIVGIGSDRVQAGPGGMDSLDALLVALSLAGEIIRSYGVAQHKKITWLNEEHLGLVPINVSEQSDNMIEQKDGFDQIFDTFFQRFRSTESDDATSE